MIFNRLTIRLRITLATFLLTVVFFAIATVLISLQLEAVLNRATGEVLESDASPYVAAILNEPGEPLDPPGEDELIAVIDPSGTIKLNTLPKSLQRLFDRVDLADEKPQTVTAFGHTYRVLVTPVEADDGQWLVVSARSQAAERLTVQSLTTALVWGSVALTLVFTGASWLLTGAALRPVSRLRRSAGELVGSESAELLPVSPVRDEVQDLARTLNQLLGDVRASTEREKQFVSDASHELRTPLAVLQAQLELMRDSEGSQLQADISSAESATRRMSGLVSDLLELSRVDAGLSTTLTPVPLIIDELADAIDRARFAARSTDTVIDYQSVGEQASDTAVGISRHDFGRLVENLVQNSVNAMGGEGTVTATLTVTSAGVELVVEDDGPGMADEFLPRAADRFSQQDPGAGVGTGLGLAIVATVVRQAGGELSLANRATGGLRVDVHLPTAPDA